MAKEEVKQKLADLKKQLDQVIAAIQIERQEAKEDEGTVIEELMINQGILEEQIANLESFLYDTKKYSDKKYVVHQNGNQKKVSIVHEHLVDASKGFISAACPLAQALLSAKVGESFKIKTPVGEAEYSLLGIE